MSDRADRTVPAPELRETADIHWDSGVDPVIRWDVAGRRFWLVDGADAGHRLLLWAAAEPRSDPGGVAAVFREGLAACDFPPDGSGVPPHRALATLQVAGVADLPGALGG